jgi:hypothetical protein
MRQGLDGTEGFYVSSSNDRNISFWPRINKCVMHILTIFLYFQPLLLWDNPSVPSNPALP